MANAGMRGLPIAPLVLSARERAYLEVQANFFSLSLQSRRLLQRGGVDRHLAQALAGRGKDGVGDCRQDADFQFDLQNRTYEFGVSKRSDLN